MSKSIILIVATTLGSAVLISVRGFSPAAALTAPDCERAYDRCYAKCIVGNPSEVQWQECYTACWSKRAVCLRRALTGIQAPPQGGILDNGPTLSPQAPSRTGTPSSR
jgi:hypothetical protein